MRYGDIAIVVASLRYYAGWADKIQGKTIEVTTTGRPGFNTCTERPNRPMRINWLTQGMNLMALTLWYVRRLLTPVFAHLTSLVTNHTVEPPFGVFILTYLLSGLFILFREWLRLRLVPLLRLAI